MSNVLKKVIVETQIIWSHPALNRPIVAIFRDKEFAQLLQDGGYGNNNSITREMINTDPDGFLDFAKQIHDQCLVAEVKKRQTG